MDDGHRPRYGGERPALERETGGPHWTWKHQKSVQTTRFHLRHSRNARGQPATQKTSDHEVSRNHKTQESVFDSGRDSSVHRGLPRPMCVHGPSRELVGTNDAPQPLVGVLKEPSSARVGRHGQGDTGVGGEGEATGRGPRRGSGHHPGCRVNDGWLTLRPQLRRHKRHTEGTHGEVPRTDPGGTTERDEVRDVERRTSSECLRDTPVTIVGVECLPLCQKLSTGLVTPSLTHDLPTLKCGPSPLPGTAPDTSR